MIYSKNFIIRCIVDDFQENHVHGLSYQLQQFVKEHFPKASWELVSIDNYWKYPGTKEVIYEVADRELYGVSRFIKMMPLTWDFKARPGYEVDLKKTFYNEDAIWSRNTHPEEQFFMPEVSWVHIYTWPEDGMMSNV